MVSFHFPTEWHSHAGCLLPCVRAASPAPIFFTNLKLSCRRYPPPNSSSSAKWGSDALDDGIQLVIENTAKNQRTIRSKVAVNASLHTVWDVLTDYERLSDFIPGLAISQLLQKEPNFARLFQIGQQNIAFGLKFDAKGIIDCYEKDLDILSYGQRRDIDFKMVEGDFQVFEGKWSIEQYDACGEEVRDSAVCHTTLFYVVCVEPKLWLPVRLLESRLCQEIKVNLSCVREEAQRIYHNKCYRPSL